MKVLTAEGYIDYKIIKYPQKMVIHKYKTCGNKENVIKNILKYYEQKYYYDISKAFIYIKNNFNNYITEDIVKNVHRIITNNDEYIYNIDFSGIFRPNKCDMFCFSSYKYYIAPKYDDAISLFSKMEKQKIDSLDKLKEWYEEFERLHLFFDNNGKTGRTIFSALSKIITNIYYYPIDKDINNPLENLDIFSLKSIIHSKYPI